MSRFILITLGGDFGFVVDQDEVVWDGCGL